MLWTFSPLKETCTIVIMCWHGFNMRRKTKKDIFTMSQYSELHCSVCPVSYNKKHDSSLQMICWPIELQLHYHLCLRGEKEHLKSHMTEQKLWQQLWTWTCYWSSRAVPWWFLCWKSKSDPFHRFSNISVALSVRWEINSGAPWSFTPACLHVLPGAR